MNTKRIILICSIAGLLAACGETDTRSGEALTNEQKDQAARDSANYTTISWDDSTYIDLGKVKKGRMVEVSFPFTNTGSKNLIITNVTAGCGCTVPETPKEPFAPGKSGVIKARFDSNSQPVAEHRKQVFVSANTTPYREHALTFRVEVVE